jgi:hypothetical protein
MDTASLADIREITVNHHTLPFDERAADLMLQAGDMRNFHCGDVTVQVIYGDTPISDCMESFFDATRL